MFALLGSVVAQNRTNNSPQQIPELQADVEKARGEFDELQKQMQAATSRRQKAEVVQREAGPKIKKLTTELERKHEIAVGMNQIRAAQKIAQEAFDRVSAPVLKTVQSSADYKAAAEAAKSASARLKTLRDDKSLSDAERGKLSAEASQAMLRPGQLEQTAVEANPQAKAARAKLVAAEEAVQAARKKVDDAIESDPTMAEIKANVEQSKKDVAEAAREIEQLQPKLAAAQQKMTREAQELATKKAQANKKTAPTRKKR